jgi:hypothetical protein
MADNYGPLPKLGPAHQRLGVFVGKWRAEGKSFGGKDQDAKRPRANAEKWLSKETTAWHPGNFFLVQQEDATIGRDKPITHAIIGYNAEKKQYFSHAVENHGFYRRYKVTVRGRVWIFDSGTERARIEFSRDGKTQKVFWEWRPKGNQWLPLCERTNVRIG